MGFSGATEIDGAAVEFAGRQCCFFASSEGEDAVFGALAGMPIRSRRDGWPADRKWSRICRAVSCCSIRTLAFRITYSAPPISATTRYEHGFASVEISGQALSRQKGENCKW